MSKDKNIKELHRRQFTYQGKRYSITASSYDELVIKVADKKAALESGSIVMNNNTTVERWCKEWLEVYKKPNVSENHYKNMESICRLHINTEIGHLKLTQIKKITLQKLLNGHEGKSFSQLSHIRSCLYELFSYALEEDLIQKNPALKLSLPNNKKGETIIFNDNEYSSCLEVVRTHRSGAWVLSMLSCGLRPQETVPLMWSDIDLDERIIIINKAVSFVGNRPRLKDTKSKAGNRIVGITNELHELLIALKNQCKTSLYVFSKPDGNMMTATYIERAWKSFMRELDISMGARLYRNEIIESKIQKKITPYSCRHTCITKLVLAGADIKTVQVFAGHEKPETTLKYYTHLDAESAAKRVLKIQANY